MSLFGSLLGDMDEDLFFGSHMRTMRHMNSMMNSLFADPFGMMGGSPMAAVTAGGGPAGGDLEGVRMPRGGALVPFGLPLMPAGYNRLLGGSLGALNGLGGMPGMVGGMAGMGGGAGHSYSSSTVVSMSAGPDGRPQVYKATSSTRLAPGGIKETQRTVSDSVTGTKKMAIGHHIGDRAHIIEKEQNSYTGDREEREDFINLEEDEADDFNREWETKTRRSEIPRISGVSARNRHSYGGHSSVPAITAGSSIRRHRERHSGSSPIVSSRRSYRSSQQALPSSSVVPSSSSAASRTPYSAPGAPAPRKSRNVKTVSGSPPPADM